MILVAWLAIWVAGGAALWVVTRASGQEAVRHVVRQQTDEVEVVARLLAGKIEQSQKVLRMVSGGVTPAMLDESLLLEGWLHQGMPAVRFFDALQVARADGEIGIHLRAGKLERASAVDPAERDALRRTLVDGKPLVIEHVAGRSGEARVLFTMPVHREDGTVMGAVLGAMRLQSQGLLPPSMALPSREDSRLMVFTRDGTILAHSNPGRILGHVRDEPGVASVHAAWRGQGHAVAGRASSEVTADHVVSVAGMPLPQWFVGRVSDAPPLFAPLEGAQREAAAVVGGVVAVAMVLVALAMAALAQPLAQLRHWAPRLLQGQVPEPWPRGRGEVNALVGVFRGLGERAALRTQEAAQLAQQFQAILDCASVGIIITRSGMLEVVGRQACEMLGYSPGSLQGRPARLLYASDAEYALIGQRVRHEFEAHHVFDGDVRFMRRDGSALWARVQGRSVVPGQVAGGTVWILEDLTATREAQQEQAWQATHDPLTQLLHRDAFDQRLRALLAERSTRPRTQEGLDAGDDPPCDGVVLFLDIDHFTVVNDVAGHDAGDDVLRHVARMIESQVRRIGWAARLGGDEFAVVLPGCSPSRGLAVAEQLRATVAEWEPSYGGRSFTLGVSIGLVVLDATLQDVPSVLYAADMACYDAKRAGRNRVELRRAREATASGRMALGPA
ncbi:diguanylate cyclase [Acidovorax lacteus]|uniref:GGDEF domain-containing protein n=1 Tax=Acidovorax lacteus TaxID=1924988 RepID=A0ABP8LHU6_9BURK